MQLLKAKALKELFRKEDKQASSGLFEVLDRRIYQQIVKMLKETKSKRISEEDITIV